MSAAAVVAMPHERWGNALCLC
ncbi:MAG: hypothetical protein R3E89_04555 [Thiolinea sp.]